MRLFLKTTLLLILGGAMLWACGVKGSPLPAGQLLPGMVEPPLYEFSEAGLLEVKFAPPTRNVSGTDLKNLGGFFIDRSENRARPGFCPGCPVRYTSRMKIEAKPAPPGRDVAVVPYSFVDELRPGYIYHYRIFAHDSDGEYDPAMFRTLIVHYASPPLPPDDIQVMAEDNLVFLKWTPPERTSDGSPIEKLAGYEIYRRMPDGSWGKLNQGGPWGKPFYDDTLAHSGDLYEYKVRAVSDVEGTFIVGPPSPAVAAAPVDLTPPGAPVKVLVAPSVDGVRLSWTAVGAADLAGYRIYRRRSDEAAFRRIGPDLVPENFYLDAEVVGGHTYLYRLTSVDSSPSANESQPSISVSVYYEPEGPIRP